MNVTMASTKNDRSRMANAGVETGAKMLGVGWAAAAVTLIAFGCDRRGRGDGVWSLNQALSPPFEAVSRQVDHEERGRLSSPMLASSGDGPTGSENWKTAPCGSFGVAHSRPPCASTIERLIDNPIPMPPDLVV